MRSTPFFAARRARIALRAIHYVHHYGDFEQLFDMEADPKEQVNLLHACTDEAIWAVRDDLKAKLIAYEARYGLPGYVVQGDFAKFEPYVGKQPIEPNFPQFTERLPNTEHLLDSLETEVFAAIEDEPTVKLSQLHLEHLLMDVAGFSRERFDRFMDLAKEKNRY